MAQPATTVFSPGGNLSGGGMFLRARSSLAPGTEVTVRFQLPYLGDMGEARGVIRWRQMDVREEETAGIGIEFTEIDVPLRERILHFIESQSLSLL